MISFDENPYQEYIISFFNMNQEIVAVLKVFYLCMCKPMKVFLYPSHLLILFHTIQLYLENL